MGSPEHNCRRYSKRGVTCPFLPLEQPEMETEEGEKEEKYKPGPFVIKYDPHEALPAWVFVQVGQLYEIVARGQMGDENVKVGEGAAPPTEIPSRSDEEVEVARVAEAETTFFPNMPEVNIPWNQPQKFFERYVDRKPIVVSRAVQNALARVIEIAVTWRQMQDIDAVSTERLQPELGVQSQMGNLGEMLYAEALKQVQTSLTEADVEASDVGERPQWYWAGLAAATIALFARALQDTSGRVVPFTGRGTGGRQTKSGGAAARGGGGGGNFVNVAEIMQQQVNQLPRSPNRPNLSDPDWIRNLRPPTPERMEEIRDMLAPGVGIGAESSAYIRIV